LCCWKIPMGFLVGIKNLDRGAANSQEWLWWALERFVSSDLWCKKSCQITGNVDKTTMNLGQNPWFFLCGCVSLW
jgi:hypothetical protein